MRRAESLFLLAGAALQRIRMFREQVENPREMTTFRSERGLRVGCVKKSRFFRSQTRLGVNFGGSGAIPGALGRSFWHPGVSLAAPA